jgi:succinate dehydrogenase/fumarate reductase-like Fe-S protein
VFTDGGSQFGDCISAASAANGNAANAVPCTETITVVGKAVQIQPMKLMLIFRDIRA